MKNWEACLHYPLIAFGTPEAAAEHCRKALDAAGLEFVKIASVRETHPARPPVSTRGKDVRERRLDAWRAGVAYARERSLPDALFERAAAGGYGDIELTTEFIHGVMHAITMALLDRQDAEREVRQATKR